MQKEYVKYGTPFIKLAEECSEVIKVCMKIERFGLDNFHPVKKDFNYNRIEDEIQDVERCIERVRNYIKENKGKGDIRTKD